MKIKYVYILLCFCMVFIVKAKESFSEYAFGINNFNDYHLLDDEEFIDFWQTFSGGQQKIFLNYLNFLDCKISAIKNDHYFNMIKNLFNKIKIPINSIECSYKIYQKNGFYPLAAARKTFRKLIKSKNHRLPEFTLSTIFSEHKDDDIQIYVDMITLLFLAKIYLSIDEKNELLFHLNRIQSKINNEIIHSNEFNEMACMSWFKNLGYVFSYYIKCNTKKEIIDFIFNNTGIDLLNRYSI